MKALSMSAALAALIGLAAGPAAAQSFEVKVADYIAPQHFMAKWLDKWGAGLQEKSGGRLQVKRFPGAQMGPPPVYYDLARRGQAEITWFLHGGTPGRFPLTEIINLPYMVPSAEVGAKVLNDPELRAKYLDAEHKGVRVLLLHTHQPGQVHTSQKPIRAIEDFKGMRLRFASPSVKDWVDALGGSSIGLPPNQIAEGLQKSTIDGVFIDYGGAGIAFKLGGLVKYSTEMYSFVTSFGIAMNPDFYDKLPADLKKIIDDSVVGIEKEIGDGWDGLDAPGKQALIDGGGQTIQLTKEQDARFRALGQQVADKTVADLEAKGLPAKAVHALMRQLAEKHAKTSRSFWN